MILAQPRTVLRALLVAALGLIAMYVGTQLFHDQISRVKLGHLTGLFNANGEQTIPAWYSSSLLLVSASLFALVAAVMRGRRAAGAWHWWGLAAIFLFLSVDESVSIHERFNDLRDNLSVGGALYFAWVVPAAGMLLLFGLVYFRFWLGLPARTRWLLALSGALYVGGALALELVGAPIVERGEASSVAYLLVTAAEELFEMLGLAALLYTLLAHIRDHLPETRVVFSAAAPGAPSAVGRPRAAAELAAQSGRAMAD